MSSTKTSLSSFCSNPLVRMLIITHLMDVIHAKSPGRKLLTCKIVIATSAACPTVKNVWPRLVNSKRKKIVVKNWTEVAEKRSREVIFASYAIANLLSKRWLRKRLMKYKPTMSTFNPLWSSKKHLRLKSKTSRTSMRRKPARSNIRDRKSG